MDMIKAYKGIAPGKVLSNELKRQGMSQRKLALETGEHYQTISAIIAGRRRIPLALCVKLDSILHFDEGFFAVIQTYYEVGKIKEDEMHAYGEIPSIRPVVFWDTDIDKLDWKSNKQFIIKRVSERGNESEISAVRRYYEGS